MCTCNSMCDLNHSRKNFTLMHLLANNLLPMSNEGVRILNVTSSIHDCAIEGDHCGEQVSGEEGVVAVR